MHLVKEIKFDVLFKTFSLAYSVNCNAMVLWQRHTTIEGSVRIDCPDFDSPFPSSLLELSVMKNKLAFRHSCILQNYYIRSIFWNCSFILTESAISSTWPYPGLTIDLILCNPSFFEKYPFLYSVYKTAAMIISKVITTKTTTTIVVVLLSPSGVFEVVGLKPLVVVNLVECWAKNICILQSFVRSKMSRIISI